MQLNYYNYKIVDVLCRCVALNKGLESIRVINLNSYTV